MSGASIEATLELWASWLREVKRQMRQLFAQDRAAINAGPFLDGLLGNEPRKTGWMRAETAGDPWRAACLAPAQRSSWMGSIRWIPGIRHMSNSA
jgi:hypothetical protein